MNHTPILRRNDIFNYRDLWAHITNASGSLARQSYKDFEFILVDQNPHFILREMVAEYASRLTIQYIRSEAKGLSLTEISVWIIAGERSSLSLMMIAFTRRMSWRRSSMFSSGKRILFLSPRLSRTLLMEGFGRFRRES